MAKTGKLADLKPHNMAEDVLGIRRFLIFLRLDLRSLHHEGVTNRNT